MSIQDALGMISPFSNIGQGLITRFFPSYRRIMTVEEGDIMDQLDTSTFRIPETKSMADVLEESQQHERASEFHKRLMFYIKEFDDSLNQDEEVGIRLVSFGQAVQFVVHRIGYYNPKIISFYGETADGSKIQLIQHVNQISFLLQSVKRKHPDQPKRSIGFSHDQEEEENQIYDQSAATTE